MVSSSPRVLSWKKKARAFFLFGLGAAVGLVIGCQILAAYNPSGQIPAYAQDEFRLMAEAWNTIERFFVDRSAVNPRRMAYGAITGMTESLGDTGHTRFLTPEMAKQEKAFIRGTLEGIGAELRAKDNQVVIVAPLDDSPAQKAGLKPGDIILEVDGRSISGLPLEQTVSLILGPPGTPVKLSILDPQTGRTREVDLVRAKVKLQNVTWVLLPGSQVAHVRIASFSGGVTADLRDALKEIEKKGGRGLILDLRNDPGGIFGEAIGVASQFLRSGNVVMQKNAKGKITPVPVKSGGTAVGIPMVALVNRGTASAAEIVAGALQDHDRAKLVGEKTFGAGTVLERFSLSDGSALLLAIQEWLTPDGRKIRQQGIRPDVEVAMPPDVNPSSPREEKNLTAEQLQAGKDAQLLKALEMLFPGD